MTARLAKRLDAMGWRFGEQLRERQWPLSPNMLVNGFLYVTLLFGRYADKIGGTQLLSPAATSALLTAELSEDALSDADLFKRLEQVYDRVSGAEKRTLRFDRPSFLPYLLEDPEIRTPADLFQNAIDQRDVPEVKEYRGWLAEIRAKIDDAGKMPHEAEKELANIVEQIGRLYAPRDRLTVQVGVQLSAPPALTGSKDFDLTGLRDRWLRTWPGTRYRRVLLNLTLAAAETVQIDRPLRKKWDAA